CSSTKSTPSSVETTPTSSGCSRSVLVAEREAWLHPHWALRWRKTTREEEDALRLSRQWEL
ncbi:unnamed protein product, partial [Bubo scandiacus]